MNRLAASLHCSRHCVPLILFRWLLLVLSAGLVIWKIGSAPERAATDLGLVLAIGYALAYLTLWTIRLPSLVKTTQGRLALLGTDVLLSYSAIWLAGNQGYTLTPFALGALILPGAVLGWRGALLSVLGYMTLDQLRQALPAGANQFHPPLLLDYSRVVLAAAIWPLSVVLQRHWPREGWRKPLHQQPATLPSAPIVLARPVEPVAPFPSPILSDPAIRRERLPAATLERRATRLQPAIRQVIDEMTHQGLQITLEIAGREQMLPPSYTRLVVKALEIALDNVRQHARTTAATVRLQQLPSQLILTVRDHGAGLLDGTAEPPGFHQLKLLRYRLHELGGSLEIIEPDDDGVQLTLSLPLTP